jgi:hypothetical protein
VILPGLPVRGKPALRLLVSDERPLDGRRDHRLELARPILMDLSVVSDSIV